MLGRDRTPPIGCRWVDINKGDEDNPEYRSRLVAKEIKKDRNQDLFAATPSTGGEENTVVYGHD